MINPTSMRAHMDAPVTATTQRPPSTGMPTATASFQHAVANATGSLQGEKLTISDEGKAALQKSRSAYQDIINNPDPDISTKQHAIPSWLGEHFIDMNFTLMTDEWRNRTGNSGKLASAGADVVAEYTQLILQHYRTLQEENGIETPEQHYNQMIADPVRSEELRRQFNEILLSDPRTVELMQKIGITLS